MTTTTSSARRSRRWLAWLPLVVSLAVMLPISFFWVAVCAPPTGDVVSRVGALPTLFSTVVFGALCGLVVTRQPRNRIGWLFGVIALMPIFVTLPYLALDCGQQARAAVPALPIFVWLGTFSNVFVSLQFILLPLWFPDGRFLSAGWRRFAVVVYALLILGALTAAVWPGRLIIVEVMSGEALLDNPFGLPFTASPGLTRLAQGLNSLVLLGGVVIAQLSLVARWRRSDGATRQQLKVFAFFLVTIGTVFMLFELAGQLLHPAIDLYALFNGWLYLVLLVLLWAGYPFAIGMAVLKYRMYDVDVVIRKTLVYTVLTALLALIYFGVVIVLQGLFSRLAGVQESTLAVVVSTLAIAALFTPLRRRIQDVIDRRFYRKKYNAQQVLAQFALTARDETDLDALLAELVRVVDETLQPEHVSVWLKKQSER